MLGTYGRERLQERGELSLAPDERQALCARSLRDCRPGARRTERDDRLALTFRHQGWSKLLFDRIAGQPRGELPDDHLTSIGALLQARRDVHDVAGHEELVVASGPSHRAAGVDSHADVQLETIAAPDLGHRITHRKSGTYGTLGVVLVDTRDAENDHDGVSYELLDGSAMSFSDLAHAREIPSHERPDDFGIPFLTERGRSHDVRKQHAHELSFFAHVACREGRRTERQLHRQRLSNREPSGVHGR
ncbi:MAG TPA: hypothetical protein VF998_09515 [Candidatus Limnocylindria bacterium]